MYRFNEGQITLVDRREMLRVKWKTLKMEIKYIKLEERKTFGQLQTELYRHRLGLGGTPPGAQDRERIPIEPDQVQVDRLASQICDHPTLSSAAAERDCSTVKTL